MLANLTPSPATLAMPAKKSEVILGKLIQGDTFAQSTLGNPIMQAGLTTLVNKDQTGCMQRRRSYSKKSYRKHRE